MNTRFELIQSCRIAKEHKRAFQKRRVVFDVDFVPEQTRRPQHEDPVLPVEHIRIATGRVSLVRICIVGKLFVVRRDPKEQVDRQAGVFHGRAVIIVQHHEDLHVYSTDIAELLGFF